MKKVLYGTTALVAAGLLCSGPAMAQAKPISLQLGGYFHAWYSVVGQDDSATTPLLTPNNPAGVTSSTSLRNHDMGREAEVHFKGSTTLDNGLQFGVDIQFEAEDCTDLVDESFIFINSQFGRLEFGDQDEVGQLMKYGSPSPIPNFEADDPNSNDWNALPGGIGATGINTTVDWMGDSEKINYFTPRIAGLQVGVTYSPEICREGNTAAGGNTCGGSAKGMALDNVAGRYSDAWGIAANYVNTFSGVGINVYAAYSTADVQVTLAGADDREEWGIGGNVSYMGFTLGAAYNEDNLGAAAPTFPIDRQTWSVGLTYTMGPWTVGAQYGQAWQDDSATTEDEQQALLVGGTYALGPGITLWAGATFFNDEGGAAFTTAAGSVQTSTGTTTVTLPAGAENSGIAFRVGTSLSF